MFFAHPHGRAPPKLANKNRSRDRQDGRPVNQSTCRPINHRIMPDDLTKPQVSSSFVINET